MTALKSRAWFCFSERKPQRLQVLTVKGKNRPGGSWRPRAGGYADKAPEAGRPRPREPVGPKWRHPWRWEPRARAENRNHHVLPLAQFPAEFTGDAALWSQRRATVKWKLVCLSPCPCGLMHSSNISKRSLTNGSQGWGGGGQSWPLGGQSLGRCQSAQRPTPPRETGHSWALSGQGAQRTSQEAEALDARGSGRFSRDQREAGGRRGSKGTR